MNPIGHPRLLATFLAIVVVYAASVSGQFRRGLFSESVEIMLYPLEAPAIMLPAGTVQVQMRNASAASARLVEQLHQQLTRQLGDNDSRLRVVERDGATVLVTTITEWNESRRNSTKYVSETRQVGTREVVDKNGKKKTEPVYEYGRNRPSVVINATAGLRVEARTAAGAALADETARHTIQEEYLVDAGPPSRDEIEKLLIDRVVEKGAGRVSPGRHLVRVLLARSDEVDRLNVLAQNRRWDEWLSALSELKPHRDPKRDTYRLHNLAVANEAVAYEAKDVEDWSTRLGRAVALVTQAATVNPKEKYITEAAERIARSVASYSRLAEQYKALGMSSLSAPPAPPPPPAERPAAAPPQPAAAMTNQDVIDLRGAGLDDENLISAIKDAKSVQFDLSPDALKALLAAKVSNRVIAAMRTRMR